MESEGRDREHEGAAETSNVVRLPRDWLGPREELVPFGPSAWRTEAAAPPPSGAARGADVLELTPRPDPSSGDCTQDDFWGGDLDAIPRPVIAPRPSPPVRAAVSAGSAPVTASRPPRGRVLMGRSLVAAVALAAGAAAAGFALSSSASHPRVDRGRTAAAAVQVPDLRAHLATQAPKVARPRTVRVARVAHRAAHPHHVAAATARTATFVKTSVPAASSTARSVGSGAAATSSPNAPVGTAPVRTTSRVTSNSTGTTTESSRSTKPGPVGRGAPFGPGQLG